MARTRTMTLLIADVRQRTNMENSEFVSDDEITEYLNQERTEMDALIAMAEGHPHLRGSQSITVTSGTSTYAVASDFWREQRVVALIDGIYRDLQPFMEGERADLLNTQYFTAQFNTGPRYRIQAENLEILPATRSFTATLYYTRCSPRVTGATTVDGFNGYELAMIYGACAAVLAKEESDPSFYIDRKERYLRLLNSMAAQRSASHPERVTDVTGDFGTGADWLP